MFKKRKPLPVEDVDTFEVQYLSYYCTQPDYYRLIDIRGTKDDALKDCLRYQHVGSTKIVEQYKRTIYEATTTVPCVRPE